MIELTPQQIRREEKRLRDYFLENHYGISNAITCNKLKDWTNMNLMLNVRSKDQMNALITKVIEGTEHRLLGTKNGMFIASSKDDIIAVALEKRKHGVSEIIDSYKMMKEPFDNQQIYDFIKEELREVER